MTIPEISSRARGLSALLFLATVAAAGCRVVPADPPAQPPQADTPEPVYDPPGTIQPVDVPTEGFGYPGDRDTIQAWADSWDIDAITTHSWNLWAGMNSSSGQMFAGGELPVWETWCGTAETFSKQCGTTTRPTRPFMRATQLSHSPAGIDPSELRLVAFNKYNPAMSDYLAANHAGPGGGTYDYTSKQSLAALNAAWSDATPIAGRKVEETPYVPGQATAIEIKPVMYVVKAKQLTAVPLWRGPQDSTVATTPLDHNGTPNDCSGVVDSDSPNAAICHPDPTTWLTCVLVDPEVTGAPPSTAPVPATAAQIAAADKGAAPSCTTYLYAPISTVYGTAMDAAEAASFNKVQGDSGGVAAAAGDIAVLMAMHINTKAIINWTWQTMWWQPGDDTVNDFPGNKKGMTDLVQGSFRNYAMCTGYGQTMGASSHVMQVCFNPFLETSTGIPDGLQSNCTTCHGTATVGAIDAKGKLTTLSYPEAYTAPIDFDHAAMFKRFTRTDFSWAVPVNAR